MNLSQWYRGFAIGYEDGTNKVNPMAIGVDYNRLWALGYMAGYLTACGIRVGVPNA